MSSFAALRATNFPLGTNTFFWIYRADNTILYTTGPSLCLAIVNLLSNLFINIGLFQILIKQTYHCQGHVILAFYPYSFSSQIKLLSVADSLRFRKISRIQSMIMQVFAFPHVFLKQFYIVWNVLNCI